MTYGASVIWNDQLLEVIENCNRDKADIRAIESTRQGDKQIVQP